MLKAIIHPIAWRVESVLDQFRGQRDKRRIVEPYVGYATPDHLVVRGRVLTALRRGKPLPTQSAWVNFRQMLSLFATDEVADVEVSARGVTGRSDEEGYFTLLLPRTAERGWLDIDVSIAGRTGTTACPVLVASQGASFGVISDIDDTMLETGAYSLVRNLWTSFTGNALTRKVFPDSIAFIDALSKNGKNPVYFVSSSPWNLHHFLRRIFDRVGLVKGPMFLRDLGLSQSQFITGTHGDHKGGSIDVLMSANPQLKYILVGDTGQHDAFVYRDAIERHPERVQAVVLREPGPGPDDESIAAIEMIEEAGVTVLHAPTFDGFADRLLNAMSAGADQHDPAVSTTTPAPLRTPQR